MRRCRDPERRRPTNASGRGTHQAVRDHAGGGRSVSTGSPETLLESEPVDVTDESAAEIAARSPLELFWGRLRRDKVALTALTIVGLMVFVAIFAPLIVKVFGLPNPNTQNDNLLDDFGSPTGPSG